MCTARHPCWPPDDDQSHDGDDDGIDFLAKRERERECEPCYQKCTCAIAAEARRFLTVGRGGKNEISRE